VVFEQRPPSLAIGDPITVVASPYGVLAPHLFCNSLAQGIIANHCSDTVFIVDARCMPGSEGGAVFDRHGRFVGLLTGAVSRFDYQPLELQFVIASAAIQTACAPYFSARTCPDALSPAAARAAPERSPFSVPAGLTGVGLIKVDSNRWATGVLLPTSRYQLVTCAHIFLEALGIPTPYTTTAAAARLPSTPVRTSDHLCGMFSNTRHTIQVRLGGQRDDFRWFDAQLEFVSPSHLDVAVVRLRQSAEPLEPQHWQPLPFPHPHRPPATPRLGDPVQIIGFGFFGPQSQLPATITQGTIARVVKDSEEEPLLLQTTAVVHQGNSGGPVVDPHSHELLGLVICNTRQRDDTVLPHLNFALAGAQLTPLFNFIANDGLCVADLADMEICDSELKQWLWNWTGVEHVINPPPSAIETFTNLTNTLRGSPDLLARL
jgi:S1-C subfamily serine protease